MGACGTSANYGSTNVWVSQDNVNYVQVATLDTPSVLGELAATFPSGSDPDTVNSLVVQLAENSAALSSGTTTAADNDTMLCFVDGEVISYSACAVTGQNTYTMGTYIRRGQLGTTISSHTIGGLFLRLDGSVFKYTYDPTWQGKTIYFKFQAVNSFGNNPQPLSNLTALSFTLASVNDGTVDASSGIILGSERLPVNTPTNTGNNCTLTSTWDSGTSTAMIAGCGPGGPGTAWDYQYGQGSLSYPSFTITGLSGGTNYNVIYDPTTNVYTASTTFIATLPDDVIVVGGVLTATATVGGGTGGGGGVGGGGGGKPITLY